MKITNISNGPRGFWHSGTLTIVPAGATVEHELDEQAFAGVKGNPESFKLDEPKAAKTYEEMTRAELDKLAEDRGVDVKDAKNKPDVIAALQLADEAAKAQQ